jgi:hypothetical protein
MLKPFAIASLLALSATAHATDSFDDFLRRGDGFKPDVIYGDDDRLDWYDIKSETLKTTARSSVALINKSKLSTARDGFVKINAQRYQDEMQMCPTERFVNQPSATFCSGFLAAPDKIITAGHCIQNESECMDTAYVFDFTVFDQNYDPSQVPETAVYNCKKVVHTILDRQGHDFAIVQLDRPVTDRQPVTLRHEGKIANDANLNVIGYPHGIPLKSAAGKMRSNDQENYFVGTLDTYGGNSGSMVLNADTLQVEGILVRGEPDVEYDSTRACYVSKVCKLDECNGEESTRIGMVLPYLNNPLLWDEFR